MAVNSARAVLASICSMKACWGIVRVAPARSLFMSPLMKAAGLARSSAMAIWRVVMPLGLSFFAMGQRVSPGCTGPYSDDPVPVCETAAALEGAGRVLRVLRGVCMRRGGSSNRVYCLIS